MRTVDEWVGKAPDTVIPPRVRLRIWEQSGGKCAACTRKIGAGERWDCDHIVALINGGRNAEKNLQVLCKWCHSLKTKIDVEEKARSYARRATHAGIKRKSRPMPGSKASRFKKRMDGTVVRR